MVSQGRWGLVLPLATGKTSYQGQNAMFSPLAAATAPCAWPAGQHRGRAGRPCRGVVEARAGHPCGSVVEAQAGHPGRASWRRELAARAGALWRAERKLVFREPKNNFRPPAGTGRPAKRTARRSAGIGRACCSRETTSRGRWGLVLPLATGKTSYQGQNAMFSPLAAATAPCAWPGASASR